MEEAFAAAERAGLVLMEAGMWRHHPQTARLVELLPEIGELQALRATFSSRSTASRTSGSIPELGGGSLLDVGWYCVSGLRLLAGRSPTASTARRRGRDRRRRPLHRHASLRRRHGRVHVRLRGRHAGLEAIGSRGTISAPDPWLVNEPGIVLNGEPIPVEAASSVPARAREPRRRGRGDGEPLLDARESIAQVRVLAALARSAETGRAVPLRACPPAARPFLPTMGGARRLRAVWAGLVVSGSRRSRSTSACVARSSGGDATAAVCPATQIEDPYEVAARFLTTAVQRRDLAASYSLATPSLRGRLSCHEWTSGRVPVRAFSHVDWSRTAYEDVAGGEGQLVIRVLLYAPGAVLPQPFLMEIQREVREPGWRVGYFARDRWYGPPAGRRRSGGRDVGRRR